MSDFPTGWFYIECLNRQGQVLTVSDMSMQVGIIPCIEERDVRQGEILTHTHIQQQPSVRVELRPKKIGGHPHQLWCYHQGLLVNKHSGCGKKKDSLVQKNALY